MDEPSLNENFINKENFADIAAEKIIRILCFPGNDLFRPWALEFLQKAAKGFPISQHEPWLNHLSTVESSEVILSNCRSTIQKLGVTTPSINSSLSFAISYPRQLNSFIAALASLLIRQIEETHPSVCETLGDVSDCGPSKRRRKSSGPESPNTDEIIRFLKHVWEWAKTGHVKLDAALLGEVLSQLPECIEEVVLSWAKEELNSRQTHNQMDGSASTGVIKDSVPDDEDMLHSLSILQESPVFLAAAASSPKLFQKSSSVLNQLLIHASECSCAWLSLLSLCKTFAQETAKGRSGFYPLSVQPLVVLMEMDPNSLPSGEQRDVISSQLTLMCRSLPPMVTVALLSHFPAWLQFLDYAMLV